MSTSTMRQQHYYLISTYVIFRRKGADAPEQMGLNTTITSDKQAVIAKDIGRAQQSVQMALHQRLPGEIEDVIDVFIVNVSYLGKMSQRDFIAGMEATVGADGNA